VWIENNDSYLTNGRFVSKTFNILEPTNVLLEYQIEANRFNVTFLTKEQHDSSYASSSNTTAINFNPQRIHEVATEPPFNPTIPNIDSLDFNFNGGDTWEKIVTISQASQFKNQTLVCYLLLFIYNCIPANHAPSAYTLSYLKKYLIIIK
jgi:hypothetical protein